MPPSKSTTCRHQNLNFNPSLHAATAGWKRETLAKRIAATTPRGTLNSLNTPSENFSTFPAPLVLPGDELAYEPEDGDAPQSLLSWTREKARNKVTPERRTIYFMGPPKIEEGLEFVQRWTEPQVKSGKEKKVGFPETEAVKEYLEAFYHGLPVKMLQKVPCFTSDVVGRKGGKSAGRSAETLWLNTHTKSGCIGIRTRKTPKGEFTNQLNLNDLLDAAIEILPADAYALLMLVEHDIYEDDDDDFACGRAYGGSRIAVVSGARYNPILDSVQNIEREHSWPVSHCADYMNACCEDEDEIMEISEDSLLEISEDSFLAKSGAVGKVVKETIGPMHAARAAHIALLSSGGKLSPSALSGLWLGRVCRTAGHELGHCFGIAHCVYYACSMQATASVVEDARQPPYLCPVDLAKVLKATGSDVSQRYQAIVSFCGKYKDAHLFAAYAAWIKGRLEQIRVEAPVSQHFSSCLDDSWK